MSHYDNSAILEPLSEHPLDEIVSLKIDVGGSLVEHKYLRLSNDGPGEADELLLASGE